MYIGVQTGTDITTHLYMCAYLNILVYLYICFIARCYTMGKHNSLFGTSKHKNPCHLIPTCILEFPLPHTSSSTLLAATAWLFPTTRRFHDVSSSWLCMLASLLQTHPQAAKHLHSIEEGHCASPWSTLSWLSKSRPSATLLLPLCLRPWESS